MTRPARRCSATGDAPRARRSARDSTRRCSSRRARAPARPTVLVDRVVALVTADGPGLPVPMRSVAAITFTEKAAAELRDRVRGELERRAATRRAATGVRERCAEALDELDDAAICTLHSFAQRILTEFPIEVGLPPRIEVRDEISSLLAFDDALARVRRRAARRPRARADGARAARGGRDARAPARGRRGPRRQLGPARPDRRAAAAAGARRSTRGSPSSTRVCATGDDCRADDDKLLDAPRRARRVPRPRCAPRSTTPSASSCCSPTKPSFKVDTHAAARRTGPTSTRCATASCGSASSATAITDAVLDAAIRRVVGVRSRVRTARARGRAARARASSTSTTCSCSRAHAAARPGARRRRPRAGCASATSASSSTSSRTPIRSRSSWPRCSAPTIPTPATGAWDEIERRRRAGCSSSATPSSRSTGSGAPTSRRSSPRATASPTAPRAPHVQLPPTEPRARVDQPRVRRAHPAVRRARSPSTRRSTRRGRCAPARSGRGAARRRAARRRGSTPTSCARAKRPSVAAAVARRGRRALAGLRQATEAWRAGAARRHLHPAAGAHVARTSSSRRSTRPASRTGPRRARSSTAVARSAISSMTLRAVDDPSDELALVDRAAVVGLRLRRRRPVRVPRRARRPVGRPRAAARDAARPTIRSATRCAFLGELHDERAWVDAERVARARRARAARARGRRAIGGRFRDVARRVRFLVDQARAFADAVGGTLRDYLAWAELQGAEGARVVEAVLPETDDDAVRIMTIHGAKGLEFPIVVCSGMTTAAQRRAGRRAGAVPARRRLRGEARRRACRPTQFELHKPIDEQMGFHEKLRLLYVACTRARDHLVVSVHRKARDARPDEPPELDARRAALGRGAGARRAAPTSRRRPRPCAPRRGAVDAGAARPRRRGSAEHDARVRDRRAGAASSSATTLAPARRVDDGRGRRSRARQGRPRPRAAAVEQGSLRHRDRSRGARDAADRRPRDAARASTRPRPRRPRPKACSATRRRSPRSCAPRSRARRSRARVRAARTGARPTSRCRSTGITLEGYVDLVFRDDDGLVVVDYKTDAIARRREPTRGSRTTGSRPPRTRSRSRRRRASRSTAACSCFLDPAGAREVVVGGRRARRRGRGGPGAARGRARRPAAAGPVVLADA